MTAPKQRLSMIRSYTLADLFTLANASCGSLAIFLCLGYIADESRSEIWAAFVLQGEYEGTIEVSQSARPVAPLMFSAAAALALALCGLYVRWRRARRKSYE